MPEFLDWTPEHAGAVLTWALERLERGELVAFPSESVYTVAALALDTDAVARLADLAPGPVPLCLSHPIELADWFPYLAPLGKRLTQACWPGPLILEAAPALDVFSRLPQAVQHRLAPEGFLALRTPGHPALLQAARMLGKPLATLEIPEAANGLQLLPMLGDAVSLILQDGPTPYGGLASVVRLQGRCWSVQREGLLGRKVLEELALCQILFVCTGNTCRSPMAAALARRILGDRLGCSPDELPGRGFRVLSAGLAAGVGMEASPEAIEIAEAMGGNLRDHSSQPVTAEMLARADYLFTMTRSHLRILNSLDVQLRNEPRLLSPDQQDVVDPLGGEKEIYEACARQIADHLERWLPEILEA